MQATKDYVRILASGLSISTGIKLIEGKSWQASGLKNELMYDMESLRLLPFETIRGLLLHEIGHLRYSTSPVKSPAVVAYGQIMHSVYNAWEDIYIEQRLENDFGAYAQQSLNDARFEGITSTLSACMGDLRFAPKHEQFLQVCLYLVAVRKDYALEYVIGSDCSRLLYPQAHPAGDVIEITDEVRERVKSNYTLIWDIINTTKCANSTQQVQTIVDTKVLPLIKDWLDEHKKEHPEAVNPPPQEGDGQAQKPKSLPTELKDRVQQGQEPIDVPSKKYGALRDQMRQMNRMSEREASALLRTYTQVLSTRLADILQEKKAMKWRGAHMQGKLLGKNAYKVLVADEPRIFSQKDTPDTPDYTIHVVLDNSGSMQGQNCTYAFMGAVLLQDTARQMGCNVICYSYDDHGRVLRSLEDYQATGGGTYDTAALKIVHQHAEDNKANIVFVITDGETSRDEEFDIISNKLEREKQAIIVGVGVGPGLEHAIRQHYKIGVSVPQVENLPLELINTMRRLIRR